MQGIFEAIAQWWESLTGSPAGFFNFSFLPKYWLYFRQGIGMTLLLSVAAVGLAILPALALALMRMSKRRAPRWIAGAYIAVVREEAAERALSPARIREQEVEGETAQEMQEALDLVAEERPPKAG